MSEELDRMSDIDSVDLASVETAFPLLDSGLVSLQVSGCEYRRDTEKKADAKPYLYIEMNLTQPWRTVARDGEVSKVVNPGDRGSKVISRIYYGDYIDKKTGEAKKYGYDRIASFRESVFGKARAGAKFSTIPMEMLGQNLQAVLKFEAAPKNKDTGETFGPRTDVDRFIKAKV